MRNNAGSSLKISIGILNRNGVERLKITIPTILKQSIKPTEIIVFDNGSSDESIKYLNEFKQIKVVKSAYNLGYGKAKT